ncbi:DUF6565 domain-containing protein [Flavobacterium cellulosilyticum]|uniref:DUF6565 domain-containing protein n=1 Tax=Flavobacterium cellulosilyticum TaxID=2541731 RepID=A0A4R5CCX4_9FLAO|nr:DUF6565 domain-containing protein [Flavobacterium cellulosilyticum]TDD96140.1 hypothetical protein E0F76_11615 [Flavobacterium cellulosilyticum]
MKSLKISFALIVTAIAFTACKDENQMKANESLDAFDKYTDSVSNVAEEKAAENWEAIETKYRELKMNAENSLSAAKDKVTLQTDFDKTSMKYEDYKRKVMSEKEKNQKTAMYLSLLGPSYVNDDMQFNWVNKNNILSVYQNFVNTVQKNKDSYSREDWDEIKLVYEALDTRKNTVEKEGLSSSDNLKIAGLKLKFSPMYTLNRMGAKSEENAEAKK